MWFLPKSSPEKSSPEQPSNDAPGETHLVALPPDEDEIYEESGLLTTIGWVSAALGAVALGLIVGREIRQRYKFNRQTPYDLYAHSGDGKRAMRDLSDMSEMEFGVGI